LNGEPRRHYDSTAPLTPFAAVLTVFEAKEGFEHLLIEELKKWVRESRREAGCLLFDLFRISGKSSAFAVYEVWELREEMEAHLGNRHTAHFRNASQRYLEHPIQVFELEEMM
jgi:quinol monooxygenase YgiN